MGGWSCPRLAQNDHDLSARSVRGMEVIGGAPVLIVPADRVCDAISTILEGADHAVIVPVPRIRWTEMDFDGWGFAEPVTAQRGQSFSPALGPVFPR